MQMDNPARGFTYKYDGPLDLRMNPQRGQTASALLATLDEPALAALLLENADEPDADRMAQAILQTSVSTTTQLATVIRRAGGDDDSVRRVFQALRIAVNDEFGALEAFLQSLPFCLKAGGRVAILTFHSGEDRRVKKSFQAGERLGVYSEIAHEVVRATSEELRANPRSRSAKLRWARRSAMPYEEYLVIDNQKLAMTLRSFAAERDWDQFHTPKNLATSISVEAAELLEIFQWSRGQKGWDEVADPSIRSKVEDELADILLYVIRFADKAEIDLEAIAERKIALNAEKYPAGKISRFRSQVRRIGGRLPSLISVSIGIAGPPRVRW